MPLITPKQAESLYQELISRIAYAVDPWRDYIAGLKNISEKCFNLATKEEKMSFPNSFARLVYTQEKLNFDMELQLEIHGFRKFANKIIFNDKETVSLKQLRMSIRSVATIIWAISDVTAPSNLEELYEGIEEKFIPNYRVIEDQIDFVRAFVMDVSEKLTHKNGAEYFAVKCIDFDETIEPFTILLWNTPKNNFTYLGKRLWVNARINIYNFYKSRTEENIYNSSPSSLIILEPDNIINASEIASCFQYSGINHLVFFLNKLIPSSGSPAALKGIMVGEVLDTLLHNPSTDISTTINALKKKNAVAAANYGDNKMREIAESIKQEHFLNLKLFAEQYKSIYTTIEPTFISEKYGLLGRLDVMTTDGENRNVIEVKSGSFPKQGNWPNNKFQAVAYHCLLKSTFENRRGTNSIFYSKSNDPNRYVSAGFGEESMLLKTRNLIAYILTKLRNDEAAVLLKFINLNDQRFSWPKYNEMAVNDFSKAYYNADPIIKAYYEKLLGFIVRELLCSKIGDNPDPIRVSNGFASLWLDNVETKKENDQGIFDAAFVEINKKDGLISFEYSDDQSHRIRKNDLVIIYPKIKGKYKPLSQTILKCSVQSDQNNTIVVKSRTNINDTKSISQHEEWAIEHDFFERNYWSSIQLLYNFLRAQKDKIDLLLGKKVPEVIDFDISQLPTLEFGNQQEIIQKALQAKDYFLIQGPPGTGKTSTALINIVQQYYNLTKENIYICAFTNRAVEEICTKLIQNNIAHTLITSRDHPSAFHSQIGFSDKVDDWRDLLLSKRVYVSTLATFSNKHLDFNYISKDLLIVDEASQVTEADLLGIVSLFKKFILIGDHDQLPPVVTQNPHSCKINHPELNELQITDFRITLFERLFNKCQSNNWEQAYGQLNAHFRMHPDIANYVRNHYDNLIDCKNLKNCSVDLSKIEKAIHPLAEHLGKSRTVFIGSEKSIQSRLHTQEAERIKSIVEFYKETLGESFNEESIGIITPWRTQVVNIRKQLGELANTISVDTVERFQGSEKNIIIISLCLQNSFQLESVHSLNAHKTLDRKLLVALSRAKEQFIILGYEPILQESKYYKALLTQIQSEGRFINSEEASGIFATKKLDDLEILTRLFG